MRARIGLAVAAVWLAAVGLAGCGGGGGGGNGGGPAVAVRLAINWAPMGRAVNSPASAKSAVVRLVGAGIHGGDFEWTINRQDGADGYTQTYTSTELAQSGVRDMVVHFFPQPDGRGAVVGLAAMRVTLRTDSVVYKENGTPLGDVLTDEKISTVVVTAGQTFRVGEPKELFYAAYTQEGGLVAVAPEAARIAVQNGTGQAQVDANNKLVGTASGIADVTVTIDHATSPATRITVASDVTVAISPGSARIGRGATQRFVATVHGSTNTAVTWSVREGAPGGTVDASGLYAAPNSNGAFHVVATSKFDPSKQASVVVETGDTHIYVTDSWSAVMRVDDFTGANIVRFGTKGSGVGQFDFPSGLFVAPDGRIYVADPPNNRIARMDDINGTNLVYLGTQGSGRGQLNNPTAVAVGPDGRIYIADSGNNRVVCVDDMSATNWTTLGTAGVQVGQFLFPHAIAFDGMGRMYIADSPHLVRVDDMQGTNWTSIGEDFASPLHLPQYAAVGPDGRIYLIIGDRVARIDDMTGANLTWFGSSGGGSGQFFGPMAVFIDQAGRIYVTDTGNRRTVRFDDMTGAGWQEMIVEDRTANRIWPQNVFVR